ncbi:MAG: GIY-YIG nuclease family protein [Bacteroidales bacterium]|nr:GIY-YIG nuclease family protein [Bacteroidales bacterium]
MTNNLARRWWEHRSGIHDCFTQKYKCHYLIYYEEYKWVEDAIRREKQLKGRSRTKKIELIKKINPTLRDFAEVFGWMQTKFTKI